MKKILFTVIVSTAFLFSCKKNESPSLQEPEDLFKNLSVETQAVLSQTDLTSMKQGYSMLSDKEQEELWKSKLGYIIKHDELSIMQRKIIVEMYDLLNKNGISKMKADNSIGERFFDKKKEDFYRNFSTEQLFFLIEHPFIKPGFSIKFANQYITNISFTINGKSDSGDLAIEGSCECLYDIGCGFGNICNKKAPCSGGTDCGLFGTSRCKGVCEQANGGPTL